MSGIYVTPEEVQRALGAVPLDSITRHLQRKNATKRVGRNTYVIIEKLRQVEPEWFQALLRMKALEELRLTPTQTSESGRK
ncbi:MAG: hypothetical protein R3337_00345 [Gammaproteobacteria bacterium]|nr:hypothetical protein [Gammaproteobacteria bacterium]